MDEKYAVYVVVIEDTEEAFMALTANVVEYNDLESDLSFDDAEDVLLAARQ